MVVLYVGTYQVRIQVITSTTYLLCKHTTLDEVFVESVIFSQFRMEGGEQMATLTERDNGPGIIFCHVFFDQRRWKQVERNAGHDCDW